MKMIVLKSAAAVTVSILIAILLLFGVSLKASQLLDLQTTYIASKDILPRTKISESDLIEISVPAGYLLDYSVNDKTQIIGKYTDIQGKIPAGSVFYKSMLYDEKSLPDYPSAQLKEGQSAYTLETDLARMGGLIVPGQRVDIYASITDRDGTAVTGILEENVRVISVKDHKGLDLDDPESTGIPYLAVLAVRSADLVYLSSAEESGTIRLFSSSRTYDVSAEAQIAADSPVVAYLMKKESAV
ncbi:MAG: hypothetical protein K6D03_05550 [Solobacterium sp.]|nr:hypothetical protein [Solobacterium sp.]